MDENFLNKGASVVLYRQLADVLKQQFRETNQRVGSRIPTEYQLADTYGVSRGTVRQALNLLEGEHLIQRIPGVGTFLRSETTPDRPRHQRQIGLMIPFTQDQLSLNILIGVESVAKYRGYQVVFQHTRESLAEENADIIHMRADGVDGMIVFPVSNVEEDQALRQLVADRFPIVLIDRYLPNLICDHVTVDNMGGGYRATEHLILSGQKEITFLYHPQADFRTTSVHERYLGYRKALEAYHIAFQDRWLVQVDDGPRDLTGEVVSPVYENLLRSPGRPRAVFAINDNTAVYLVNSALRIGMRVPEELAVVGFDDLRVSSQIQCPLTTIHQERTEVGIRAANLLLARIDGYDGPPENIVIPTNLVVRESCGARLRLEKDCP